MEERKSNLKYKMMVIIGMPIRNLFMPPGKMLQETDIRAGYQVLDFGCGPGTFTIKIAERVGSKGIVHALDIHPLAKKYVERKALSKNLSNVNVILSDCSTLLPENSIDYAIMFDVYHELGNPESVLIEIKRVLKPNGILCFSDHHMSEEQIIDDLTKNGLYALEKKGERTLRFRSL
jgi:ubiquinone/menaquinone biosynthesis C-methylase UbiE